MYETNTAYNTLILLRQVSNWNSTLDVQNQATDVTTVFNKILVINAHKIKNNILTTHNTWTVSQRKCTSSFQSDSLLLPIPTTKATCRLHAFYHLTWISVQLLQITITFCKKKPCRLSNKANKIRTENKNLFFISIGTD